MNWTDAEDRGGKKQDGSSVGSEVSGSITSNLENIKQFSA